MGSKSVMRSKKEWVVVGPDWDTFESQAHSTTILSGLNALRSKGHLLDITLIAQEQTFQAHKVVLASCSDYFRAMFTDAMLESRQSEVRLNGVSAAGMRLLLDYVYTSRLVLSLSNVEDVLSAASHLQLVPVVEACSNFLQAHLDVDNCVDVATLSELYSLSALRSRVYAFMSSRLVEVSQSAEFSRLHPSQLEHLLDSDFPVDCPESQVLTIVLAHLYGSNVEHRAMWLGRLLRKIHLCDVVCWELDSVLEGRDQLATIMVYTEAIRQRQLSPLVPAAPPLVNSRGMELAIVKVGGFGMGGVTNEITYLDRRSGKWRHLTSIPHVEQCSFGTAVLHNDLYVVGGCFNQTFVENIHPFGFRYSPKDDCWTTMAPLQRERCRFSLNVLDGCLYAVGGTCENFGDTDECERYLPENDIWERVEALPGPSCQHSAASLGSYLYVSGGLQRDLVLNTVYRYDPESDSWSILAPMLSPRADHVMVAVSGNLYVCGGWMDDDLTGNRALVERIDRYDAASDSWSTVSKVPSPRYHAGIVPLGSKLYFIGGIPNDDIFDKATATVECYDIESNTWTTEEQYPRDIWEHTCVTLYIPRCRDDMEVLTNHLS